VLAHLLDFEKLYAGRIAQALRQPGSPLAPSDAAQHDAAARAGRVAPVPQLIHGLLASRRQLERLLDEAGRIEEGIGRFVVHAARGPLTIADMVRRYGIEHEAEHAAQIEALRAAMEQGTGNQEQG
jgi:hypothetical protein